jgi:hypothetical protein
VNADTDWLRTSHSEDSQVLLISQLTQLNAVLFLVAQLIQQLGCGLDDKGIGV